MTLPEFLKLKHDVLHEFEKYWSDGSQKNIKLFPFSCDQEEWDILLEDFEIFGPDIQPD